MLEVHHEQVIQVEQHRQSGQGRQSKNKLQFGHYKVVVKKNKKQGEFEEEVVVCKPLTQDEITDGWRQVLPTINRTSPIHHWSVTLAQLPPHLWKQYRVSYNDGKKFYPIIKDGIYNYSVNQTNYDLTLVKLYKELKNVKGVDVSTIETYLKELENVNGWLINRARKFLTQSREDRYVEDLCDLVDTV